MKIELRFGAMCAPLASQLALQGVRANKLGLVAHWQRDADAITRLSVRGLLTDGQAHLTRQRLLKNIAQHSAEIKP